MRKKDKLRSDLILAIKDKTGHSEARIHKVVEAFFEMTKEWVDNGNKIRVSGFGIFYAKRLKARDFMRLKYGGFYTRPEHDKPKFNPLLIFRQQVQSHLNTKANDNLQSMGQPEEEIPLPQ